MFSPTVPTTASAEIISASTFGPVNPQPVPEQSARVVSEKNNSVSGFLPGQDRVSITQQARDKAVAEQITENNNDNSTDNNQPQSSDEFIQVSSSIGRAAQSGNLSRQEALAIYQKIASLI